MPKFLRRLFHDPVDRTLNIGAAIYLGLFIWLLFPDQPAHGPKTIAFKHQPFFEQLQAQTVQVSDKGGEGSGVVVKRGDHVFVWTAAHVVRGSSDVAVKQAFHYNGKKVGEKVFTGHVVCRLKDLDAALLWVDAPPSELASAVWARETPAVGEKTYAVGNLLGHNFEGSVSAGIVSQLGVFPDALPGWPWELVDQTTALALPGSSGGPVFNTKGQVVGLIVGGPGRGVSCYIPLRLIYAAAQESHVVWALWGDSCPPDKVLEKAIIDATAPKSLEDFLKGILGP